VSVTRRAALAFALLALFALSASAQTARQPDPPVRIEIRARPIAAFQPSDPARTRFGALTYRGGIELTSPYPEFGGVSPVAYGLIAREVERRAES